MITYSNQSCNMWEIFISKLCKLKSYCMIQLNATFRINQQWYHDKEANIYYFKKKAHIHHHPQPWLFRLVYYSDIHPKIARTFAQRRSTSRSNTALASLPQPGATESEGAWRPEAPFAGLAAPCSARCCPASAAEPPASKWTGTTLGRLSCCS